MQIKLSVRYRCFCVTMRKTIQSEWGRSVYKKELGNPFIGDNMNIVMAMNMGGMILSRPFDLEVLTAKIQALLRRSYDFAGSSSMLEHKGAVLKLLDASLIWNGQQIELTKNELKILQTLMEHKEKIVSREELMEKLWKSDAYVDENTLSVNVNRLRKKLSSVGLDDFILTKKGINRMKTGKSLSNEI